MYQTTARCSQPTTTFSLMQSPICSPGFIPGMPTDNDMDVTFSAPTAPNMNVYSIFSPGFFSPTQVVGPTFTSLAFRPSIPDNGYDMPSASQGPAMPLACGCLPVPETPATTSSGSIPASTSTSGLLLTSGPTCMDHGRPQAPQGFWSSHTEQTAVKEAEVPNEIKTTVLQFKKCVLAQKKVSLEIATCSPEAVHQVQAKIESLKNDLYSLSLRVTEQMNAASGLKLNIRKCVRDAEMVRRVHNAPPALQLTSTEPLQYLHNLAAPLLAECTRISIAIDEARRYLQSSYEPRKLTPEELHTALSRITDTLVTLSARTHSVHVAAQHEMQRYRDLRRRFLTEPAKDLRGSTSPGTRVGPTPFPAIGIPMAFGPVT